MFRTTRTPIVASVTALAAALALGSPLHAEILTSPTVTGGSNAFGAGSHNAGSYPSGNVFNGNTADYASAGQGANTYLNFDFGTVVKFDRVIMVTRNSPDGNDRFAQVTLTYDSGSDTIVTNSGRGRSDIYDLGGTVATQTVQWDVDTLAGGGATNTGMMEMVFLKTPYHASIVSGVSAYNAAAAHSAPYVASNAVNGVIGFDSSGSAGATEYASNNQGANMFIDFDLGAVRPISGFDLIDRLPTGDQYSGYNLIFSNVSNFASVIATQSYTKSGALDSDTYNTPINARYVRLDVTAGAGNTGVNEMIFYERNVLANPTILSDPSEFPSGTRYIVEHLFDDQLDGVGADWAANGEGPTSMVLDFGQLVSIDGINWANRRDSGGFLNDLPASLLFEFSDDLIFDAFDESETIVPLADQVLRAYMFAAHEARYVRVTVTGQNPPAGNVGGAQLDFFGVVVPSPAAMPAGLALLAAISATRRRRA